ncbi:polysaccharide deacetylase family protein [Amylibacter sp.]|nr:polysaccharide deacetylase family protein [Amylibacter sp.]
MLALKKRILSLFFNPFLSMLPSKKGLVILTLHRIPENQYGWFDLLIKYISHQYGFIDPINLKDEFSKFDGRPRILLTFDDGFYSNRVLAEAVLEKYRVKALFFLTEDFLGDQKSIPFVREMFYPNSPLKNLSNADCLPMSWSDVNWLLRKGHMIGAHTKSHPVLSDLIDHDNLVDEIVTSADRIEEKISSKIDCFAFPFGSLESVNRKTTDIANNRFEFVFSNIRGSTSESPGKQFIFRQNIVPGDPIWFIKLVIEGKLDWKYSKPRRLAKMTYNG